jgi:hypothetical protein
VAAYATANASGTFNVTSLTIPEGASMSHTIKAIDSENNTAESSFFSKHRITVTPSSGTVGSEVVISGTGFSIGREIAVRFNYEAVETKPVSIMTDSNGSFTGKIHIPYRAVNPYTVEAGDGTLKDDAVLDITFGGKFSRVVGCIDSGVTFNGAGFIPGRVAVVSFDGVPVNESTVDNSGRLACSFEVPVAAAGEHTVTITDGTNSLECAFTVVFSASVETNRDTGYVGSDIIFSGTGFIPGKVAVISYDSIPVAESDIDSDGDFSAFFSIPASVAGEHIISATDGFNTVNSTFTMESLAPPSPVLLMPEEDGETEPEVCFVWEEVADRSGVTYNLQVFADAGFQSGNISGMVLEKFDLPGPRYVLSGEEVLKRKSTPYYWRVRAVDGAFNTGEFSEVQSFCVSPAREPWFYCSLVVEGGIFGGLLAIWVVRKRRNSASQAGGEPVTEDI